jgi:hypothetical protein
VKISCTRSTETISMYNKEEMGVVVVGVAVIVIVEGDSCVKKEGSAVDELNRRGTVQ